MRIQLKLRPRPSPSQVHGRAGLPDLQRAVDDRQVRELRQRDPLLDGDLPGDVLRIRVPDQTVVGGVQVEVHRTPREAQVHQEANLHHR